MDQLRPIAKPPFFVEQSCDGQCRSECLDCFGTKEALTDRPLRINVNYQNAQAKPCEGSGQMKTRRTLAYAALLID